MKMDTEIVEQKNDLLKIAREKLLSSERGIWLSGDCILTDVSAGSDGEISGVLDTTPLNIAGGDESGQLALTLFESGQFSMRSRLQQSGFNVDHAEFEAGKIRLQLSNLTGLNVLNVPQQFALLRFFIEDDKYIMAGAELKNIAQQIVPDESKDWFIQKDHLLLFWRPELTYVITADNLDLKKIIEAPTREELHKILKLESGHTDNLQPRFYLAGSTQEIAVPSNICLRILTNLDKNQDSVGVLPHLNSPVIDPSFTGQVMFEHTRSLLEEDDRLNKIAIVAYKYSI